MDGVSEFGTMNKAIRAAAGRGYVEGPAAEDDEPKAEEAASPGFGSADGGARRTNAPAPVSANDLIREMRRHR